MSSRAIFCIDPGGTTGVAWGVFDDRADTVAAAMRGREDSGSATIHHGRVEGVGKGLPELVMNHVSDIHDLWWPFHKLVQDCDYIEVVMEHFVLTGGTRHKAGVEGIVPAFILGALFNEFAGLGEEIILQTAGKGMQWHKRKFHENYNTWIVGKEHEREAWAHVAARLHAVIR